MKNKVLFLGNGVNNLNNKENWSNLLRYMLMTCGVENQIEINNNKPFPLLYEEIYLKSKIKSELKLKINIAQKVDKIKQNEIHEMIIQKNFNDVITTNYDYTLQKASGSSTLKNQGVIKELRYSIFRHNNVGNIRIWHIHGECNAPSTIILGYEHYSGQLQQMRNYVVSGTHYSKKRNQKSLLKRLKRGEIYNDSWIDFFFTKDIHIVGLTMDFVEIDIWWLLTYRARLLKDQSVNVSNKVFYYIPQKYVDSSINKIQLLKSIGVTPVIKNSEGFKYYKEILNSI